MATSNRNHRQSGNQSQQRRNAQSGQYGGQNSYRYQKNQTTAQGYGSNQPNQPQQLASNMPQQSYVQRGNQQQTLKTGLTAAQKKERAQRKREQERRRRNRRRILAGILVLLVIVVGYNVIRILNGSAEAEEESLDILDLTEGEDAEEAAYNGPPVATISFVGDISASADQISAVTRSDGTLDFSAVFEDVADHISGSDYAVANFESTIVDGLSYGGEPYYNAPVQLAGALNTLGIKLVSTANTYMLNNGIDGVTSTRRYLRQAGLATVGTYGSQEERDENGGAYIRTIHKIKFAFLSYTKGTESVTMPDGCEYAMNTLYTDYSDYWTDLRRSQIRSDIQAAKAAGAEVIIMLVHWGSEYGRSVSQPQKELCNLLFSYGVDVIVGTHSHVVNEMGYQEVTLSDGTDKTCFVAYGLGDFYTDPAQENGQTSVILNLTFARDEEGNVTITDAGYIPIYQNITEKNGIRTFELVDVYHRIASIYRSEEVRSSDAELYNRLLDAVDTLTTYAGEEYDAGPADEDLRVVRQAIEAGEYSVFEIRDLQDAEKNAAKEAAAADGETLPEDTDQTEDPADGIDDTEE